VQFDDPSRLADLVARRPRPLLVGLDVDGVLAPLVDHPDDSQLLDGVADTLVRLAAADHVDVVVISGRSLAGLEHFGFDPTITVIGSHGMETRGTAMSELDPDEADRLRRLTALAERAADDAGPGSMVEHKPAGVVLHTRRADPDRAAGAIDWLRDAAGAVAGTTIKPGSNVLELLARTSDKGRAIAGVAERRAAATTVFVGDDVTDEDAFARLGDGDVTVKVGDAPTIADHRLEDPAAVLVWLRRLVAGVGPTD
jgi:trehalose-phosphatase